VRSITDLGRVLRDLDRLREVAQTLLRSGFGWVVAGLDIPGLAPVEASEAVRATPERAVAVLQELGPTFVKLGQVLSTRPDLLPADWIRALERLQDDVGPLPWSFVEAQLVAELGQAWQSGFAAVDEVPLATASIAQVHAATLCDGTEVVLKVQRPNLDRVVRADLAILEVLARRVADEFPETRAFDPVGVVTEFAASLLSELDYREEARNQIRVARQFADSATVRIPKVYPELSGVRVLVMERLRGVRIRDAREAGCDMAAVGDRYLAASFDMLFVHGFFHGDLHPGNVLVLPGDVIGLLDFGMMGHLTPAMRTEVILIIFALQRGDYATVARMFHDIAIKDGRVDYAAVERDTVEFLERNWAGRSLAELDFGPYIVELARKAAVHGARIPSAYTMFFKALVTTEGLARTLVGEVDPIAAAAPYVEKMIEERLAPERLQSDLLYQALTWSSLGRRLPVSLGQLLDDLDHQRLSLEVRQVADPVAEAAADARQRSTVAMVAALGLATLTWLALGRRDLSWGGVPVVSVVGGVASCVAWMVAWRAVGTRRLR
jgi:ubiquinone biosynthesis protein